MDLPQRRPHPLVPTRGHRLQDVVLDEREPTLWIFVEQLLQPLTW